MRIFFFVIIVSITLTFAKKSDCYYNDNNFLLDSISDNIQSYSTKDSSDFKYISKVIIKMYPIHCKRGPAGCEKCNEFSKEKKYCFVGILQKGGKIQRPMMEINLIGIKTWYEFDQFKIFNTEEEAIEYSKDNSIRVLEEEK
jgi:hypothetical protein